MKKPFFVLGLIIILVIVVIGIASVKYKNFSDEKCGGLGEGYIYVPGSGCVFEEAIVVAKQIPAF